MSKVLSTAQFKQQNEITEIVKKMDDEQAKTSYDIPYGGLFEYVSCANYCKYDKHLPFMIITR